MSPHTGNPGIVRTVYSDISRNIQGHSAIFCHVQAYCTILRQSEAYSGIIETYEDLIGAWRNCCIYNHSIFRTLAYLKPEASSKACRTCKMIMHIHTPLHRTVYSSIFKDFSVNAQNINVFHP